MNEPVKVDPGRVDHLAKGLLKGLTKKYGNPQVKFALAMFEEEVDEILNEELGPGTKAHEVGKRIMRALEGGK
jgi:hypothetical protein